jgi:hypothetical protein
VTALPRVSKSFIEYVLKRHKDWIEVLKLKSMFEIENYVREALETVSQRMVVHCLLCSVISWLSTICLSTVSPSPLTAVAPR